MAAAYCLRPRKGATVSAPLKWEEVGRGLDPAGFNINTMPNRLDALGDLWKGVSGPGVDLAACLEKLAEESDRTGKRRGHPASTFS